MAILNYTTKVDHFKTLSEIMKILSRMGATDLMVRNNIAGYPEGLAFAINYKGVVLNYRLPCNVEGVFKTMIDDPTISRSLKNRDQALRVAWRILKDWVEAQMAIVQAGLVTIPEVFFPYMLTPSGETIYHQIEGAGFKRLT